jgi:hypothetical protein
VITRQKAQAALMEIHNTHLLKTGYYSSLSLCFITLITFGFALTAVPISGAFCPSGCISYPYTDSLPHFPKDYIWMFTACFMLIVYLAFVLSIEMFASSKAKIYVRIGLIIALLSVSVLLPTYFVQFSVIPASLINNETEGIAILTQYNPHGLFIALEELGYFLMAISFLFIAPAFMAKNRVEVVIRWIYVSAAILIVISFTFISGKYGILREDRFEVLVISIDWLALIINSYLISRVFKRAMIKI